MTSRFDVEVLVLLLLLKLLFCYGVFEELNVPKRNQLLSSVSLPRRFQLLHHDNDFENKDLLFALFPMLRVLLVPSSCCCHLLLLLTKKRSSEVSSEAFAVIKYCCYCFEYYLKNLKLVYPTKMLFVVVEVEVDLLVEKSFVDVVVVVAALSFSTKSDAHLHF